MGSWNKTAADEISQHTNGTCARNNVNHVCDTKYLVFGTSVRVEQHRLIQDYLE